MSKRDRAPTAARRRIPWPLAVVLVLLVGYGVLWLASSQMSKSLLDGAKLRLLDPTGQPVPDVAVLARWFEPRVLYTGCDLGKSNNRGEIDLTPLHGKTAVLGKFQLAILLPGYEQDPITLEPDTTVDLPAVGKVVVQLRDGQGGTWSDPSLRHMKARLQWSKGEAFQHFQKDGCATFAPVACAKLKLFADLQGYEPEASGEPVDGPAGAGQTSTINITIPDETPRLTGVVHGSDDKPVAATFSLSFDSATSKYGAFEVTSGADGRWQFLLSSQPAQGKAILAHPKMGQVATATRASANGVIDFGKLQFPKGDRP